MDVFQPINWLFNDQEPTLRQTGRRPTEGIQRGPTRLRAVDARCGHLCWAVRGLSSTWSKPTSYRMTDLWLTLCRGCDPNRRVLALGTQSKRDG